MWKNIFKFIIISNINFWEINDLTVNIIRDSSYT